MNYLNILFSIVALGSLGVAFGALLTIADKKFRVEVDERVSKIRECLPGANCGACGYPGCDGYAIAVAEGKAAISACSPGGAAVVARIAELMGMEATASAPMVARVRCQGGCGVALERYTYDGLSSCRLAASMAGGPKVCQHACLALGDCIKVCKFDALSIHNGLIVVDEDKCTACGMCVSECPRKVIAIVPKPSRVIVRCQNADNAKMAKEACATACIGCRRCVKACQFGAIKVEGGFASIDAEKCTNCGECVNVCPSHSIINLAA